AVARLAAGGAAGAGEQASSLQNARGPPDLLEQVGSGRVFPGAIGADAPRQTLAQDAYEGGGDQERLDPQIHETRDRGGGVVGVQRAKDQMSGLSGLEGDPRRLRVADLAHQNDVRVLAEDRAQAGGERDPGADVDLDLVDPLEQVLDRVLDGDDVLHRRL